MLFVALLRGINVGGKNKIDMKSLKASFEKSGMHSVATYLNTGNIIFQNEVLSKNEITTLLEEVIAKDFGLEIKVLIKTLEEMTEIMKHLPEQWTNDKEMRSDVLFLWDEIDDESILEEIEINPKVDTILYAPGALLWSVARENQTKSKLVKLIGTPYYKQMTIRNVNTTRKIYEKMLE